MEKELEKIETESIFKIHKIISTCMKNVKEIQEKHNQDLSEGGQNELKIQINNANGAFGSFRTQEAKNYLKHYFLPFLRQITQMNPEHKEYLEVVEYIAKHGQPAKHLFKMPETNELCSLPKAPECKDSYVEMEYIMRVHEKVLESMKEVKVSIERGVEKDINDAYYIYQVQLNNANGVFGALRTEDARKYLADYFLPCALQQNKMNSLYKEYLPIIQFTAKNHKIAKHLMRKPTKYQSIRINKIKSQPENNRENVFNSIEEIKQELRKNEIILEVLTKELDDRNYVCPIGLEILEEPVIDEQGITYEKANIERWLNQPESQGRSPVSRDIIQTLVPNLQLKAIIQEKFAKRTKIETQIAHLKERLR